MKPENYRFVSLKQDIQDQWATLGASSRSEFSVNTIMWCKGSSVGWETLVTTVEGRRKAQHLIGGGAFSSPHGCFIVHPWGDKAKNLVEVGDNPSGLQSFWDKSQEIDRVGSKISGIYRALALDGLSGCAESFPIGRLGEKEQALTYSPNSGLEVRREKVLIPGFVGVPSDKGFSHALLSPIFAVYGTGVLPCVGYLGADGTIYCLAADTHYYVEDLRDAGLGLGAGFRLKAAELPPRVALVGELVAPVAFC